MVSPKYKQAINSRLCYSKQFLFLSAKMTHKYVVVVVATRLLPRDGSIAEDHGAPEAGKIPKAWSRDRKETESPQKAKAQKVRCWTVQNEM